MGEATGVGGFLIDLDGTVYQAGALIPGAVGAVERLRALDVPFLFTTNTSRKSRAAVVGSLARLGLAIVADEVLTAPVAAARWLAARGLVRVQLLLPPSTHEEFRGFDVVDRDPDAVVVGDLGAGFEFGVLNAAFRSLREGARLVAVHRNRFWITRDGPTLDAGPFVAALEYAARCEAALVGKPAPAFFELAAAMLGVETARLAVVGDDVESDIRGARDAGLTAVLVRTGKYDEAAVDGLPASGAPHAVIPSIGALPGLLG
jgi:HAD superfamily hydrolase (TIGR01458 family)